MKNIPNQLTMSRILLVFIFVVLAHFDDGSNQNSFQVSPQTA